MYRIMTEAAARLAAAFFISHGIFVDIYTKKHGKTHADFMYYYMIDIYISLMYNSKDVF